MSNYILSAERISKNYGGNSVLRNASVKIKRGEIYGLVGKNGSGKTTLFRILTGQIQNFIGKVSVGDTDGNANRMAAVINTPSLYLNMSAAQNLKSQACLIGIHDDRKIEQTLNRVGLKHCGSKAVKDFSLGMTQRLKLAMALIDSPDILILDEPSNGLDPDGIAELRGLLLGINRTSGITILVSSHILSELEQIATRIGILHGGMVLHELDTKEIHANGTNLESVYLSLTRSNTSAYRRRDKSG